MTTIRKTRCVLCLFAGLFSVAAFVSAFAAEPGVRRVWNRPDQQSWIEEVKVDYSERVWAAKSAPIDSPLETIRGRVVDYGDHIILRHDADAGQSSIRGYEGMKTALAVDADGDGEKDDCMAYHHFSMTDPLCPRPPGYDIHLSSASP